jgi:hypothetical protein
MVRRALILIVVLAVAACADVPAYQRGRLAHPTMAPAHAASPARAHLQAIHEGAAGGTLDATSGCGCN